MINLTKLINAVLTADNFIMLISGVHYHHHDYNCLRIQKHMILKLTHWGRGLLNCLNAQSRGLNNVIQLLNRVSLKIYNKSLTIFVNWNFQEILTKDPSSAWGCDTSGNIPPCGVALSRTCRGTEFHFFVCGQHRHGTS